MSSSSRITNDVLAEKPTLMIGQTISHYRILEKIGEARLRSSNFGGQGGLALRSMTLRTY